MTKVVSALDLISNAALVGAAAAFVVRPRFVSQLAQSQHLRQTRKLPDNVERRLTGRLASTRHLRGWQELARFGPRQLSSARSQDLTRKAGRRLNASAAMLALSVLADSAIEHYRGSFQNRAMYTPLVASTLTLGASLFGSADPRAQRHVVRNSIYALAAATGFAGLAFHTYNILKRPGGMSWLNLFYAAPVGAPAALVLAGLLGRGAERVRGTPAGQSATVLGLPAGRTMAAVSAAGIAGTVGEAGLLHFRGAYHDPAMVLPVTVPPIAAALLGATAVRPTPRMNRITRGWLRLTALLGFVGVGFHAYGVSRNMAGWRNWSQNVLNGPPLPAPPSFTGLALAGLAALSLIEEENDV